MGFRQRLELKVAGDALTRRRVSRVVTVATVPVPSASRGAARGRRRLWV